MATPRHRGGSARPTAARARRQCPCRTGCRHRRCTPPTSYARLSTCPRGRSTGCAQPPRSVSSVAPSRRRGGQTRTVGHGARATSRHRRESGRGSSTEQTHVFGGSAPRVRVLPEVGASASQEGLPGAWAAAASRPRRERAHEPRQAQALRSAFDVTSSCAAVLVAGTDLVGAWCGSVRGASAGRGRRRPGGGRRCPASWGAPISSGRARAAVGVWRRRAGDTTSCPPTSSSPTSPRCARCVRPREPTMGLTSLPTPCRSADLVVVDLVAVDRRLRTHDASVHTGRRCAGSAR